MKIIYVVSLLAIPVMILTACNGVNYTSQSSTRSAKLLEVTDAEAVPDSVNEPGSGKEKKAGHNTEDYDHIIENKFLAATQNPLSTFSIDVDEAAYSNIRRYIQGGGMPPAGAVRIEEMINYFDYAYPKPMDEHPFTVTTEISACPWSPQHRLVHIGLQGKEIPVENLPPANFVFLIDVSGSMSDPGNYLW